VILRSSNTYISLQWAVRGFAALMTNDHPTAGANKINSLQNGMLPRKEVHVMFDTYRIGINPDVSRASISVSYATDRHGAAQGQL
jgi:hypothetical protein